MSIAKSVAWINSHSLSSLSNPPSEVSPKIKNVRVTWLATDGRLAPLSAMIGRGFCANDSPNQAEGRDVVVRLIGLPGGIRKETERRVFRLVVIVGVVLIVAALIFMFWQKFPAEHPVQNIPVPLSK
jgi:hypothetical protein